MKKLFYSILFIGFLLICNFSFASTIKIGLFTSQIIKSVVIIPVSGSYELATPDRVVCAVVPQNTVEITVVGNNLQLKCNGHVLGNYSQLFLKGKNVENSLKVKSVNAGTSSFVYEDGLEIAVKKEGLCLINIIDVEQYVMGVIEAEAGSKQNLEYYKLQAIICRTYALGSIRKHEADNYNLCDKVHCQVYKGKSKSNPDIIKATKETEGMVIVDTSMNIIQAAFHSNCGGETVNSENVWTIPVSYLKSVKDTFCSNQPHAYWKKSIKISDWQNYLVKYNITPSASSTENALCFVQDERGTYYLYNDQKIPLKNIRDDWKLRSTYFDLQQQNDSIIFTGRGFGHGVGLCQEGSMKMAALGYSYLDILNYYYTDIRLVNLDELTFLKVE